jgi:glycosyltransferase involved in cell wall biosynthesis
MKVSICMITYNHERFIAQAIESVMMQVADFDYELVIGEDKSTDTTREICLAYQAQHPDKIRVLTPETNQGMMHNFVQTYTACNGEYVALLDGDDYWTSPEKLQIQVNFLDTNPGYSMCFTRAACFDNDTGEILYYLPDRPIKNSKLEVADFLGGNFIPTCTVMFRRRLISEIPLWFANLSMGDWPLHILNTLHGPAGYLSEITGYYRLHAASSYSGAGLIAQMERELSVYEALQDHLHGQFDLRISEERLLRSLKIARRYLMNGHLTKASQYFFLGLKSMPLQALLSTIPLKIAREVFYSLIYRLRITLK